MTKRVRVPGGVEVRTHHAHCCALLGTVLGRARRISITGDTLPSRATWCIPLNSFSMWAGVGSLVQPVLGAGNKLLRGGRWQPPETLHPARRPHHLSGRKALPSRASQVPHQPDVSAPAAFEQPATAQAELEAAVQRLSGRAVDWQALGPAERAVIIRKCVVTCKQVCPAQLACTSGQLEAQQRHPVVQPAGIQAMHVSCPCWDSQPVLSLAVCCLGERPPAYAQP